MKPLGYADTLVLPRDGSIVAQAGACGALRVAHRVEGGGEGNWEVVPWGTSLLDRLADHVRRLRAGHVHRFPLSTEQDFIDRIGGAGVQVVHAHGGPAALRALPPVRRLGLTLFASLRPDDLFEAAEADPAYAHALPRVFRRASRVFATTHACYRRLIELECPREKVELLPYGIELRPMRARRVDNRDHVRAVSLGPFTPAGGHLDLLEALALTRERGVPLSLELIGDGPEREGLEARAARTDLAAHVRISVPEVTAVSDALLDSCDLYVHAALADPPADRAGPPDSLVRAMAAGVCAVTRGHEGAKLLIRDEVTGLLCEDDGIETLADALQRACDDAALRVAAGAAGRVQVARDHNLQLNALRLREYYEQAGDGGGQS